MGTASEAVHPATDATAPTMEDPFVSTPPHAHPPQPLRHAAFDPNAFSLQADSSPRQARLALEAHVKETDRRIQEASKLGTSLVQQRKDLAARLKDLSQHKDTDEIGPDLRKKLADLEREYTDVGRETARAVLPKSRLASNDYQDPAQSPAVFAGVSGASPSKVAVPSRKQRNQQASRVHDIEFATEISTSLLAQVRSLQTALVEKDDALKQETAERAHYESEHANLRSRLRHLDENEQKYKDENWNLETQMQDLTAAMKAATDREQRTNQSYKTVQSEKETMLRELEDLKQKHGNLNDEVATSKRSQESELHLLRRDLAGHESERDQLHRKIDELTSQNTELARAISYRMNGDGNGLDHQLGSGDDELTADRDFPETSPPPSPTKRGAGQGVLETETLRSSIQHAHRMIQTLKNNIHREKTEKLELKRMLQDARDELESKRGDNKANTLKNRRSVQDAAKARKVRADQLGANRVSREEIIQDEDWEDHDGDTTFRAATNDHRRKVSMPGAFMSQSEDSTDAFETANERETSTETEAFQTGNEAMDGESSGEATETEGRAPAVGSTKQRLSSRPSTLQQKRASFMSTASTSADEDDDFSAYLAGQPKYKVKNIRARGSVRESTPSATYSPSASANFRDSPAFSHLSSNRSTPVAPGQTLGDELDGFSDEASMGGTPSRSVSGVSAATSPDLNRRSVLRSPLISQQPRAEMVDSGMMTEPWEPKPVVSDAAKPEHESKGVLAATAGALGGLVTGTLLSRSSEEPEKRDAYAVEESPETSPVQSKSIIPHQISSIFSSHTEPVEASKPTPAAHQFSSVHTSHTAPVEAEKALPPSHQFSTIFANHTEPVTATTATPPRHAFARMYSQGTEPFEAAPVEKTPEQEHEPIAFDMSPIKSLQFEPWSPSENSTMFPVRRSSRRVDAAAAAGAGALGGAVLEKSFDDQPNVSRGGDQQANKRAPFAEIDNNAAGHHKLGSEASAKSVKPRIAMSDEGTQTMVSSDEIDRMMRDKTAKTNAPAVGFVAPASPPTPQQASPRRQSEPGARSADPATVLRRPGSSGSIRKGAPQGPPPPLPMDYSDKILVAGSKSNTPFHASNGSMGPPLMPASAYRLNQKDPSVRSRTSTINTAQKAPSVRGGQMAGSIRSPISRRSSVSSFASEIDHRLNPNGAFTYPSDIPPATDPRMITAITQTMIGEYLWKYTRSPLSTTSISSNRHRRFFWVHPYTRTLYWSEHDPSTAGKSQLKAKSVAIEAVRVISDDNVSPPGLYSKSLVIVTPAREIVFTAPTSQRHETWYNALSYLLLRTAPTTDANTAAAVTGAAHAGGADDISDADIAEFNPSYVGGARSTARPPLRASHMSVKSYASSTASRRPHAMEVPSLTPAASAHAGDFSTVSTNGRGSRATGTLTPRGAGAHTPDPSASPMRSPRSPSVGGRISSFFSSGSVSRRRESIGASLSRKRSRTNPGGQRVSTEETAPPVPELPSNSVSQGVSAVSGGSGTMAGGKRSGSALSYRNENGLVASQSAEDLRRRIEEEEMRERMENVRACCDGKHDVGSLAKRGESFRGRGGASGGTVSSRV